MCNSTGASAIRPNGAAPSCFSAWQQYEWTGTVELLRRHYAAMQRYVGLSRQPLHRISLFLTAWGIGLTSGPSRRDVAQLTPVPLTATAFYYADAAVLAKVARLLGNAGDAVKYEALARNIGEAFNQQFFDSASRPICARIAMRELDPAGDGIVPAADRAAVLNAVVQDVDQPRKRPDRRRRWLSLPAAGAGRRRPVRRYLRDEQSIRHGPAMDTSLAKARPV